MTRKAAGRSFFDGRLIYTIGDEDNRLEWEVLREGCEHVVSIAGSGGRMLPLVARRPRRLTCVDISLPQLYLSELRLAALRGLDRQGYQGFLGFPPEQITPGQRESIFGRLSLPAPARAFLGLWLEEARWVAPVYLGQFERTLTKLSKINRLLTGRAGGRIFDAATLGDQLAYLEKGFPQRAFKAVVLLLGNAAVLNSLLYKGELPKKNIPGSAYSFYKGAFARLFTNGLARESYFLQMVFLGKIIFSEGNPAECDPEIFCLAKQALDKVEVEHANVDILEWARTADAMVDFLALSDVPTFFHGSSERSFLQDIRPRLRPGAIVVTRGHLRVCQPDTQGFAEITPFYEEALRRERTQLWHVQIYQALS